MSETHLLVVLLCMFAATFPVRYFPMVIFNRIDAPAIVKMWFGYVPIAIFSTLIITTLFGQDETDAAKLDIPLVISCLATFIFTLKTKSLGWAMILGFGIYLALRLTVNF